MSDSQAPHSSRPNNSDGDGSPSSVAMVGTDDSTQQPAKQPQQPQQQGGMTQEEVKGAVLNMLDTTKQQRFHIKTILVSGVGFFTDSYDLFVISLVIPMLQYIYFDNKTIPAYEKGILTASSLVGTLIGQVLFGYLGDTLGRKKVYGLTLIIMSVCAVGSAFSFYTPSMSIITSLSIWRVMLGVGIGGDYPLSAVLTSEYSNVTHRGAQIAAVFAMQGFGILVGAATILILLQIFPTPELLDYVWRFALAVGVIPAMITAYFRFQIPETPRFLMAVKGDYKETIKAFNRLQSDGEPVLAEMDDASPLAPHLPASLSSSALSSSASSAASDKSNLSKWKLLRASMWVLIGTSVNWFLLDIAFYSQSLFQPSVLQSIQFFTSGTDIMENLRNLAIGQFCIALLGTVPGYWATVFTVDRLGRRTIQLMGFIIMTLLYLILATAYVPLSTDAPVAFVIIYALTFFFTNFGPNSTTFIIPSEVFPTRIRSTAHGISAACGKSGAILGAFAFAPFSTTFGLPATMGFFTALLVVGVIVTWFLTPETAQKTLEELENTRAPIEGGDLQALVCFRSCSECRCLVPVHGKDLSV